MLGWQYYISISNPDTGRKENTLFHWDAELDSSLQKYLPPTSTRSGDGYPYLYSTTVKELTEAFTKMDSGTVRNFHSLTRNTDGTFSKTKPPFADWNERLAGLKSDTKLHIEEWDKS